MAVEDTLEVQVKTEADKAAKSLDAMIDKIGGIASALNKIDVSKLSNVFGNLQKSMNGINSQISNMGNATKTAGANMSKGMKEASKAADDVKKKTQEMTKGIDTSSINEASEGLRKISNLNIKPYYDKSSFEEYQSFVKGFLSEHYQINVDVPTQEIQSSLGNTINDMVEEIKLMEKEIASTPVGTEQWKALASEIVRTKVEVKGYKDQLKIPSTGVDEDIQKTDSLGNKVAELKNKLKDLSKQGLNFGDADFDKTYQDLNKAEKELNEYRNGLIKVDDEQKKVSLSAPFAKLSAMASSAASRIKAFASSFANGIGGITKMGQSVDNLASKLAKLFIGFQALKGIGKTLLGSIESASDYIEGYNYFDVAFTKIADESKNQFKQYGYDDAQSYADSFEQRLKTLNSKLTGFDIDKSGELSMSGGKSLGMDITQMTQYEAQIGQMTNSVGMMGEASLTSAKAMARLAGDMSSLTNMPIEQVMQNFTSGLSGMAMAVKKYGIDITQATLQEYAYKLGVDKKVATMTQAEKTYLREIAIVQQSKVAWGDQSDTINQLANQYRMLQAGLKNTAILIGRLLKPAVEAVLPYLNAMVLAINDGLSYIGKLAGIKFNDTKIKTPELDTSGADSWGDMDSAVQDTTKNIEKADKAQKKINKQLQGFDKLNNLTTTKNDGGKTPSTSTSGGGGGDVSGLLNDALLKSLADYEKYWNKHFKNMQNDAEKLKEKIKALAKEAWETGDGTKIGGAIADGLNTAIDAIDKAWPKIDSGMKKVAKILATAFNELVNKLKWEKLGKVIGNALKSIAQSVTLFLKKVDWDKLGRQFSKALKGFLETSAIAEMFRAFGAALRAGIDLVFGLVDEFTKDKGWEKLGKQLLFGVQNWLDEMNEVDKKTGLNGWEKIGKTIFEASKGILTSLTMLIEGLDGADIGKAFKDILDNINFEELGKSFSDFASALLQFGIDVVEGVPWEDIANSINGFVSNIDWKDIGTKLGTLATSLIDGIKKLIKDIDWNEIGQDIGDFISGINFGEIALDLASLAGTIVSALAKAIKGIAKVAPLETAFAGLFLLLKGTKLHKKAFSAISTKVKGKLKEAILDADGNNKLVEGVKTLVENVVNGAKALTSKAKEALQTISNKIVEKLAAKLGVEATWSGVAGGMASAIGSSFSAVPGLMKGSITALGEATAGQIAATIFTSLAAAIVATAAGFQLGKKIGDALVSDDMKEYQFDWKFSDLFDYDLDEWKQGIADWWVNDVEPWWSDKALSISTSIGEWKEGFNLWWEDVKAWWKDKGLTIKTGIGEWKEAFKLWWEDVKAWWSDKALNLKMKIGDIKENIKEKWDAAKQWWNDHVVDKLPKIKIPSIDSIKSAIKEKWESAKQWWNNNVKLPTIKFAGIAKDKIKEWLKPVVDTVNKIIDKINDILDIKWKDFKIGGKTVIKAGEIKLATIPKITGYESGGYPRSRELFYANENGRAELIGRQGNRATVVNNDQIIKSVSAGVSDAVFNTMNPVLTHLVASINKLNNSNTGTPLYVEGVNEGDIVRITTDANRDYKNRTGRPLYA